MHGDIRRCRYLALRVNGMAVTGVTTPSTAALLQQCDYLLGARPGDGNVDEVLSIYSG